MSSKPFLKMVLTAVAGAAVVPAFSATASADEVIEAQTVWRFNALSYTIDQGEPLLFRNADAVSPGPHNVVSTDNGSDGKPLFESATIPNGEEAPVDRATRLRTGSYDFICTVHPFMQATLAVTDQGTPAGDPPPSGGGGNPAPPPGAGAPPDTRAPVVRASLVRGSLRSVRIVSDEPADVALRLTVRTRNGVVSLFTASTRAQEAGGTVAVSLRLAPSARRTLSRLRIARLTLAVEARDAAGNVGTRTIKHFIGRG